MSLCRRGRENSTRKEDSIDLTAIVNFIKVIEYISCTILLVSIIGIILIKGDSGAQALYLLVIIVSGITTAGGIFGVKFLNSRINNK